MGEVNAGSDDDTSQSGSTAPQVPPMGWNSWNSGIPLTEQSIKETIDAMISSGMQAAGYRYVNLDAGWAAPSRDSAGHLRADPARFPGGISALARYAHDHGMFLGLYSSPFNEICGQGVGTAGAGYEEVDARTFAAWEVDFLKYDWCRVDADHAEQVHVFTAMRDALRASGRRITYSINPNSSADPTAGTTYDWQGIADMTRNTSDLLPLWHNTLPTIQWDTLASQDFMGVTEQLAAAAPVAGRSRPGYWNDPDMLVVGLRWEDFFGGHLDMVEDLLSREAFPPDELEQVRQLLDLIGLPQVSLTEDEQRTHFSLWAMLAAPLMAGNDVRSMSEQTRAILTNRDVIAIDQDPLVEQGRTLPSDSRIMVKRLADGSVAIALFNPDGQPATIETSSTAVGLEDAARYTLRDLWAHTDTITEGRITGEDIPAHGVVLLRVDLVND